MVNYLYYLQIIVYVQAYKSLLSNIKKEYEFFIEELEKNQLEFNNAQDELIKLKSTNLTIYNLENSKTELKKKLNGIKIENERFNSNLNKLLNENEKYKKIENQKYSFLSIEKKTNTDDVLVDDDDFSLIPGLSVDKSIDLGYLTNLLSDLEFKINDLTLTQAKKYSNKQQKTDLEVNLAFFKPSILNLIS